MRYAIPHNENVTPYTGGGAGILIQNMLHTKYQCVVLLDHEINKLMTFIYIFYEKTGGSILDTIDFVSTHFNYHNLMSHQCICSPVH